MAQVFRTTIHGYFNNISFFRQRGETLMVGEELFARAQHSQMLAPMDTRWSSTQDGADQAAIAELERVKSTIDALIETIRRPLPAAAAADSSAAGRAQAAVAS
jgi:hypothetical protein